MPKEGGKLVEARKVLHHLWDRCLLAGFVGRCYSRRKDHDSPIPGSNIVLFDGEELVVIWQEDTVGPIRTATFVRSEAGALEQEVRNILKEVGLIDTSGSP